MQTREREDGDVHALNGNDATTVHRRRDLTEVDSTDDSSDTDTSTHDDTGDDKLGEGVGSADENTADDEEDVSDGEDGLATDLVRVRTTDEGTDDGARRESGDGPLRERRKRVSLNR